MERRKRKEKKEGKEGEKEGERERRRDWGGGNEGNIVGKMRVEVRVKDDYGE